MADAGRSVVPGLCNESSMQDRHQTLFSPFTAATTASRHPSTQPPLKKQKMSLSQTYFLAHTARGKLSTEAARADHDLRLLVGHANLLDALMIDLHEAEREQEAWLEATVRTSSASSKPAGVKWVDREMELDIPESDDEQDSDDSDYEEDDQEFAVPLRRIRSPPPSKQPSYYNDMDEADDPESDDDSSPPSSPSYPQLTLESAQISVTDFSSKTLQKPQVAQVLDEDFLHPNRQAPMVAAY
ncbi:hypothetical protein FH972_022047 [Carpinus fangiana]|uniref:Uncharacterized protein n=1 Tax=Carpinus fangiana TaxID=176857 RepID=A0A5N6KTA6_9ROSI|nr:hypothetical protein FH972_022047 [Carpinus fangiana]